MWCSEMNVEDIVFFTNVKKATQYFQNDLEKYVNAYLINSSAKVAVTVIRWKTSNFSIFKYKLNIQIILVFYSKGELINIYIR